VGKRDRENYSKAAYSEADDLCHIAWLAHMKDKRSVSLWYLSSKSEMSVYSSKENPTRQVGLLNYIRNKIP
jgi:hypothetical protein